jgi:hypothetical protein
LSSNRPLRVRRPPTIVPPNMTHNAQRSYAERDNNTRSWNCNDSGNVSRKRSVRPRPPEAATRHRAESIVLPRTVRRLSAEDGTPAITRRKKWCCGRL